MKDSYKPIRVSAHHGRVQWRSGITKIRISSWPDGESCASSFNGADWAWGLGTYPVGESRDPRVRVLRARALLAGHPSPWRRLRLMNFLKRMEGHTSAT